MIPPWRPAVLAALLCMTVLVPAVTRAVGDAGAADATGADRPNLVLILADDLDQRTTPYWEVMTSTRELLADRGVTFTEAFAPTPICCPARASILTGKYGHNTGVLTNGGDLGGQGAFVANGNEDHTIGTALHGAGYRTALLGKYLNDIEDTPGHIPPGWDDWRVPVDAGNNMYTGYDYTMNENGQMVSYGSEPDDYLTDVLGRKAQDFIQATEADDAQPFLLHVTPTAPHLPLPPAPRHADNPFATSTAPRHPNFQEADLGDKPDWLQRSGERRAGQVERFNDGDWRRRMGSLYALDEMVAGIVAKLDSAAELDRTWIVFTSDNGYNLGAHRLLHKMAPYEESMRVPMVVAGPGTTARADGHTALLIDLAPTMLDLAGVPVPADMDGRSLAPVLRGGSPPERRADFLVQYAGGALGQGIEQELAASLVGQLAGDVPAYRALRTERWLYVQWRDIQWVPDVAEDELYDLHADPWQFDNLIKTRDGKAEYAAETALLSTRLDQLATCKGATCH